MLDELVDSFDDGRKTNGFNFQIDAVGRDLAAGRTESAVVPLATSLKFQEYMDLIRSGF